MEYHEVCDIFPPMSDEEFEALKKSIAEIGVVEPIWLYDGKVIDGKNRIRAVEELGLGIQYKTREWRDHDPEALLDFVNAKNLHRRHLSPSPQTSVTLGSMRP
jgi:ParB-like chromosome segregation protein Spo0J